MEEILCVNGTPFLVETDSEVQMNLSQHEIIPEQGYTRRNISPAWKGLTTEWSGGKPERFSLTRGPIF